MRYWNSGNQLLGTIYYITINHDTSDSMKPHRYIIAQLYRLSFAHCGVTRCSLGVLGYATGHLPQYDSPYLICITLVSSGSFWVQSLNIDIFGLVDMSTPKPSLIARFMGPTWAHLGPTGPRWAPCWPHELCYLVLFPYVVPFSSFRTLVCT